MTLYRSIIFTLVLMLGGCTTIEGPTDPEDPFEGFNRSMYKFNSKLDQYALKPVAKGYDAITPQPVQKGVGNFFSNLGDVIVIANDLLQLKLGQALSDTGRLLINTTFGLYGLIDWASDIGLEKHDEDFGQTLGYWGVSSGPYLVLPVFGPGSVRDSTGGFVDANNFSAINNEVHEGYSFSDRDSDTAFGLTLVATIDGRAKLLKSERLLGVAALDPYIFVRDAYLQRRRNLVHDGNPPLEDWELDDDEDYLLDDVDEDDLLSIRNIEISPQFLANLEK
ncbi:MAG: VacJ family lipoprotein [Pseudomonadota bacterium]